MKILFIGAGNMGQAIICGVIEKEFLSSKDIYIYETNKETSKKIINRYKVNIQKKIDLSITDYDVLVLAIKPQVFLNFKKDRVMKNLASLVNDTQLLVSIMAGININKLNNFFCKKNPIIRVMPNTPALIGQSMSVICASPFVTSQQLQIIKNMFKSIGKIEVIEEKYMDAVTALSGSGPAYVFTFIEAMVQGGVLCGLSRSIAEKLAIQTVVGASLMIDENNTAEKLKDRVTSPGGTTVEGLAILERNGFRSTVIESIRAAAKRSRELSC